MTPLGRSPLLDALIGAAVDATAARRGWLLAVAGDELVVVAAASSDTAAGGPGGGDAGHRLGARGAKAAGWAGAVMASRRPVALAPEGEDPRYGRDLVVGTGRRPGSLLCFPCFYQSEPVAALQLVDKAAGAPFSLDDVELITLLAEVAGAAVAELAGAPVAPAPDPAVLGTGLRFLAAHDPARYATVATVVSELLGHG